MKLLNKDIYNQINKKTLIYKNFNLFIKYINYYKISKLCFMS